MTKNKGKRWAWSKSRPFLCGDKMVSDWELYDLSECPARLLAVVCRPPCLWQGWNIFDKRGGNWLNGSTPRLSLRQAKEFASQWAVSTAAFRRPRL
jgi:hypothetical protein